VLDKSAIAFEHNDKVILRTSVQGSEVLVFEGLEVAGSFGQSGLPVNCATFEIKHSLNEVGSLDLHGVRHQHQVDGAKSLDFHREDTVDAG